MPLDRVTSLPFRGGHCGASRDEGSSPYGKSPLPDRLVASYKI
jgi:hypothetical protein